MRSPSQADLERVFFLDDEDRALVGRRRGEHLKLGFARQLATVRWLGTFLEEPLDVPEVVLEFVAEQLAVEDPSQVKRYTERRPTPFDHQREIRQVYQWKDFASVEPEFVAWVAARSWALSPTPSPTPSAAPRATPADQSRSLWRRALWRCHRSRAAPPGAGPGS